MTPVERCLGEGDFSWFCQGEDYRAEIERLEAALAKPLRETILAVLRQMPSEAAPEHLAAQIESQVRAWQAIL